MTKSTWSPALTHPASNVVQVSKSFPSSSLPLQRMSRTLKASASPTFHNCMFARTRPVGFPSYSVCASPVMSH
ncbi:hypothetical protein GBI39_07400 [Bifidobacterium longum]|nr:hypothetical protein GBI39_07400 [Bifidobacterium longum]